MFAKKNQKPIFILVLISISWLMSTEIASASWFSKTYSNNPKTQTLYTESVKNQLNPQVLGLALRAYNRLRQQGIAKKNILTIIDYSLPSTERRMWVVDLNNSSIPFHTLVAHGKNSGANRTVRFSNAAGSRASSLGVFVTGDTYVGGNGYSLNLYGLEKEFNDHAYQRRVVIHGAPYVNERFAKRFGRLGLSWGCPAVSSTLAPQLINYIKKGSVVFAYYPDPKWLRKSAFLKRAA